MIDKIGGRKFTFGLVLVVISAGFVMTGKLTAENWTSFAVLIGGIYVAGNLGADAIAKKNPEQTV